MSNSLVVFLLVTAKIIVNRLPALASMNNNGEGWSVVNEDTNMAGR